MNIVQLSEERAKIYQEYLSAYKDKFNKEPGTEEVAEAFFCAVSEPITKPQWAIETEQ